MSTTHVFLGGPLHLAEVEMDQCHHEYHVPIPPRLFAADYAPDASPDLSKRGIYTHWIVPNRDRTPDMTGRDHWHLMLYAGER